MKETITIDGIEYVKKDKKLSFPEAKRFSFTEMNKIIIPMKKTFSLAKNPISEEEALEKLKCVHDPANVGMISGKSEEAKRLLSYFVDKEDDIELELPTLKDYDSSLLSICSYSLEYLKPFIDILNITDDKIKIKVKNDYPLTLENKDFILILAPRIKEEGDD